MPKRDYLDLQARTEPLAYLITFRTYGTWWHGEDRGSIDRRKYNRYRSPDMPPNPTVLAEERNKLKTAPLVLNQVQRKVVESAIQEVCDYRSYTLQAVNARTNHVHVVVAAKCKPEHVMDSSNRTPHESCGRRE